MAKKKGLPDSDPSVFTASASTITNPTTHPDYSPVKLSFDIWACFYRDHLKFETNALKPLEEIWQDPEPGLWSISMLPGISQNATVAAMHQMGIDAGLYADNLDVAIPYHDRDPNQTGPYLIQVRARQEADKDNENRSADDLKEQGIQGITSPERLILEAVFYLATEGASINERHLDVQNITLCAGSHGLGGAVPRVFWSLYSRRVRVYWFGTGSRLAFLRSRSVVS